MNFEEFNLKRSRVEDSYSCITDIAKELNCERIYSKGMKAVESLREDNFNIVVTGEFSSGKSTFINALLGKKVIPSFSRPTTTTINKVSFGEEVSFHIHYRDREEVEVISEEYFESITADMDEDDYGEDNENCEERLLTETIEYIDIKYPLDICREGIEIIDTPGTNDLDQKREEITFKFIPNSDVAIMLMVSNQICSQSEFDYLKDRILENDIKKVFFIINHKDKLKTEEDREKVRLYAEEHLSKLIENPRIFMVSAKEALRFKREAGGEEFKKPSKLENIEETGFPEMEAEIKHYLANERGNIKLKKHVGIGYRIANELINETIKPRLNGIDISAEESKRRLEEKLPYLRRKKVECHESIQRLKVELSGLEDEFTNKYSRGLEAIARQANLEVSNYEGDLNPELIAKKIESVVAPMQKELHYKLESYKQEFIDTEIQRFSRRLEKVLDDITFEYNNALVPVSEERKDLAPLIGEDDGKMSESDIMTSLLAGGLLIAAFHVPFIAIPAAIFGGEHFLNIMQEKKRRDFLSKIKMQIDKRYGEIIPAQTIEFRKAYRENIGKIVLPFEKEVNSRIKEIEAEIENRIRDKRREDLNNEEEKQKLRNHIETLNGVKKMLEEVI